jgi:hypothetical protein
MARSSPDRGDALTVQLAPAPRVLIPVASAVTGLSEKAIRRKIEDGKWLQGEHYWRDPDGHVWIDLPGVMRWVASGRS